MHRDPADFLPLESDIWDAGYKEGIAKAGRYKLALAAILDDPYGCAFCDSGKLRNPEKGHEEGCGYGMAASLPLFASEASNEAHGRRGELFSGVLKMERTKRPSSVHCTSPRCGDEYRPDLTGVAVRPTGVTNVMAVIEHALEIHNGNNVRLTIEMLPQAIAGDGEGGVE